MTEWTCEEHTRLHIWLERQGYKVHVVRGTNRLGQFEGKGVLGKFFWSPEWNGPPHALFADNERCFDKLATCPLILRLPCDLEKLPEYLEFLGSDEGYEWSNSYAFYNDKRLPREWPLEA